MIESFKKTPLNSMYSMFEIDWVINIPDNGKTHNFQKISGQSRAQKVYTPSVKWIEWSVSR